MNTDRTDSTVRREVQRPGEPVVPGDWWHRLLERMADPEVQRQFAEGMTRIEHAERKAAALEYLLDRGIRLDMLAEADDAIRSLRGHADLLESTIDRAHRVLTDAFGHAEAPYSPAALEALSILAEFAHDDVDDEDDEAPSNGRRPSDGR